MKNEKRFLIVEDPVLYPILTGESAIRDNLYGYGIGSVECNCTEDAGCCYP